ncbi:hypothetical protein, partial [Rhizobium sp. CG5]|uniref:hypothetical protein n=1 Tax=Rhizobium sp. CG5 TaxID=2726076 RepID=UPI0020347AA5
ARLVLLQYADNLFVCETVALHSLVLSIGQSLLQNGLVQRGKVTRNMMAEAASLARVSQSCLMNGVAADTILRG